MASSKVWNRRTAALGGAALAAGGYWALRQPSGTHHFAIPDGKTFRRGNAAEPETLDPSLSSGVQEEEIIGDLMEGLVAPDIEARPIPGLATHWTTSPDGLTWTFMLREALWSDGEPITADDFVFSWRRTLDPATASTYAYFLYPLKNGEAVNGGKMPGTALGARAIDARTLEVTLEHPAPYFLEMLTHEVMSPLPRHVVEKNGRGWAQPGSYVGSGAYVLKEWVPNGHILLEKNPRFYDAANVVLEKVYYYPTDDYAAALQRMRAGELDTQAKLPAERIDWIRANMPGSTSEMPMLLTEIIAVNHTRKPFDDVRVRHAMNLALNREALTSRIRRVGEPPAYSIVPPTTADYPGGNSFDFKSLPQNQRTEQARALMRAAGFGEDNRAKATYMIRATTPGSGRAVAAAVQQMLAQIYLDVAIVPNDMQVFYPAIQVHDFDIAQAGWQADFNDAATFLELYRTGGGNNWGLYSNPAFDRMMDAAQADTDLVSRGRKLAAAEAIVLKDHAAMPLWFWVNPDIVWPYVKGWKANPQDYHRSRWVTIDQAARLKQFT
jgi:oligopeptide transport system substrate-binding protein